MRFGIYIRLPHHIHLTPSYVYPVYPVDPGPGIQYNVSVLGREEGYTMYIVEMSYTLYYSCKE